MTSSSQNSPKAPRWPVSSTTSLCPSAPVDWRKQILAEGNRTARAVVCNAGNANAFTGAAGEASVRLTAETIAGRLGILPDEVLVRRPG